MIMDYKEKYEEVLKKARKELQACGSTDCDASRQIFRLFPELKESEDEKIRNEIIYFLSRNTFQFGEDIDKYKSWIAWLEKQGECGIDCPQNHQDSSRPNGCIVLEDFNGGEGFYKLNLDYLNKRQVEEIEEMVRTWNKESKTSNENIKAAKTCKDEQKPDDKVRPKFKIGDWVFISTSDGEKVVQIDSIEYFKSGEPRYITSEGRWFGNGTKAHLWTLEDAKDGDVLYFSDETIVIFKDLYNATTFHSYCHIEDGLFDVSKDEMPDWWEGKGFRPATKEQCDLLFQKMKEAGYEWDAEKKELKRMKE